VFCLPPEFFREKSGDAEENKMEFEFQKLLKLPIAKDCLKHGRKSLKKNRVLQIMPCKYWLARYLLAYLTPTLKSCSLIRRWF